LALRAIGSVFAEVEGIPEVLALHGWARRGSDFGAALGGLGYVAPDLPGFGASPVPSRAEGAAGYAEMLTPIVDLLAPSSILVGHSFGGRIATVLAASEPERFGGLVLVGVPLLRARPARTPSISYRLARLANRWSLLSDARMERFRERYGSLDYRAAAGVMREVLVKAVNETYENLLSRLDLPVTLLWGESDDEVPLAVAEKAASMIPKANIEVVAGAGHFLPTSHPHELRRAIEALRV
jgi:pimeloyl-ACP methyl ester carboxylesterase